MPVEPTPSVDARVVALYDAHYRSLVGLAALVVDGRDEAEEIVQDAFVRLYSSFGRLRDPDRSLAYLRSIVLNLARKRLRHRAVVRRRTPAVERDAVTDDTSTSAPTPDERAAVLRAVRALPERQADCILLRYYQGCTDAEVARALGISTGTVKTHLHRAHAALAVELWEHA
jgi:RNA polymerase sigma-70 factor (sigma-E family)